MSTPTVGFNRPPRPFVSPLSRRNRIIAFALFSAAITAIAPCGNDIAASLAALPIGSLSIPEHVRLYRRSDIFIHLPPDVLSLVLSVIPFP